MTTAPTNGWVTIADVARRLGKTRQTVHNWVTSGFILTLGYRVRRDYTGYWLLYPPSEQ
jgi:hypothetical protein